MEKILTLEATEDQMIRWYVDASYASHEAIKGHTGACFSLRNGMIASYSKKQK